MEIPEINMITDFQAGMKCLQNPSVISRFFSIEAAVPKFQFYYSFWKWGALIFAIFATFGSLVRRLKLIFVYFHGVKPSLLHQKLEQMLEFSDDEDDDDVSLASSSTSSDDGYEDEEEEEGDDDYFRVKGSRLWLQSQWQNGNLWQNSLACQTRNNVVRFWDNLGLNLDFDEDLIDYDPNDVVSTWGFDHDHDDGRKTVEENTWNIPFTAEPNGKGAGVFVRGYDSRIRRRTPAIYGEWSSTASGDVSAAVSGERVFVRDNVGGFVAVGDVRNLRMPLNNLTASVCANELEVE